MSHLEADKLEEPEFKWLKKKEGGKRYRHIHFYESFVYEGVEYSLYDSVYLQVECEQLPYIGKLVEIWEEANKSKKIRVQWFFRPSEILYYLRDTEVIENELFLASGCGKGLANINPLETIVGKCNVVCVSTDDRNPKISEDEEKMADHVFYRIFDVQNFMISDQFSDIIGKLRVDFVFNKKESLRTLSSPKLESNEHDAINAIAIKGTRTLVIANSPNISPHSNGDCNYMVGNNDTNAKKDIAKEELPGDVENGSFIKERSSGVKCTNVDVNFREDKAATSIIDNRNASGGNIVWCNTNSERDNVEERKSRLKPTQFEENMKSIKSCGLNDTCLKRGMLDDTSSKNNGKNNDLNSSKYQQDMSTLKNKSSSNDKHIEVSSDAMSQLSTTRVYPQSGEMKHGHDSFKRKDLSSVEGLCLGDALSKKAKLDDHKLGIENNMEVIPKLKEKNCGIGQARENNAHGARERKDLTLAKDSCVIEGASKKAKFDGSSKTSKLNKNDVFQNPKGEIHYNEDGEGEGEIFEASPRPKNEKRTWLKLGNLSWESMKTAQNEGKLVLLQNLDPTLTSAEVKDIIWHAFKEKCMAKMMQCTAISSPHNGKALLIFNTREVAERVLKELDDKCLMLLDQRPLVGCTVLLPEYPRKQTAFVGHLSIDQVRRLRQREMKEAVSTSHHSQPNTIEYEMAMEWLLLQSKSNIWCQKLFEQHKVESRKLVANLQVK